MGSVPGSGSQSAQPVVGIALRVGEARITLVGSACHSQKCLGGRCDSIKIPALLGSRETLTSWEPLKRLRWLVRWEVDLDFLLVIS